MSGMQPSTELFPGEGRELLEIEDIEEQKKNIICATIVQLYSSFYMLKDITLKILTKCYTIAKISIINIDIRY